VLVVAEDRTARGDAEVGAETTQPPGVLGGDHVRRRDLLGEPWGGVAGIADRGGGEDEDAGVGGHVAILSGDAKALCIRCRA
jgi:hypothetical protein